MAQLKISTKNGKVTNKAITVSYKGQQLKNSKTEVSLISIKERKYLPLLLDANLCMKNVSTAEG